MPTIWGLLGKSLVDNEKIEEAINRLIAAHNDDETAHLSLGQSLQSHKASEIIDHLATSVLNDKLQILSRAYVAIVDPNGNGDYINIQDAIDYAASVGGGDILIAPGRHIVNYDITMSRYVDLIGTGKDLSVIDFNNNINRITGAPVYYKDYLITENLNTTTIFKFDADATIITDGVKAGMYIDLEGDNSKKYTIISVDSETQVTIDTPFVDSDEEYVITIHEGIIPNNLISNLTIKNSHYAGCAIDCENKLVIDLDEVAIRSCYGIYSNGLYPYYFYPITRIANCDFFDNAFPVLFKLNNCNYHDNIGKSYGNNPVVFSLGSNVNIYSCKMNIYGSGVKKLFMTYGSSYRIYNNNFRYINILLDEVVASTGFYFNNNTFYMWQLIDTEFTSSESIIVNNIIYCGASSKFVLTLSSSKNIVVGNYVRSAIQNMGSGNLVANNIEF